MIPSYINEGVESLIDKERITIPLACAQYRTG